MILIALIPCATAVALSKEADMLGKTWYSQRRSNDLTLCDVESGCVVLGVSYVALILGTKLERYQPNA